MNKIEEYFNNPAISNSLLGLMWNPRWVKLKMENPEIEDDDKKYFRIGSALDCLLTSPERWELDFKVVDAVKPWGLMGKFIDNLPPGLSILSPNALYQEAYDKSGYKMSLDKVIAKFWENIDAVGYYAAISNRDDRIIISKDEYEIVLKAKELITANEFLKCFFERCDENVEILHQLPIYFEYRGEKCKGLLDGVVIDHKHKTIQPFDLKTTGKSVYDFPLSYLQFGYYRQCAFYEIALQSKESPVRSLLDQGYEMLDFVFIVVENKLSSSHPAIKFKTNAYDRKVGLEGGWIGRKYYKGVNELIDAYKYHRDSNYWDLPLDLLQSKGEIELNIFDHAEEYIVHPTNDEL